MGYDFRKLKQILSNPELTKDECLELIEIFAISEKLPEQDKLLDLIQESPRLAKGIIENYRNKQAAFALGDNKLWQDILEKEQKLLAGINE